MDLDSVAWIGAIASVKTMADGGGRITLDIPDDAFAEVVAELIAMRGKAVRITVAQEEAVIYGRRDDLDGGES